MERTKTLFAILFVVAAFALVFLSVRTSTIADEAAPGLLPDEQVKMAPDFALPDAATGQALHLQKQARTEPVVLDFWATWCGPCREELPHLQALSQRYKGRVGFYGINSSDPPANIVAFARQNGLTFPTLSDGGHQVAAQYGADAIPLLLVIDTDGKLRSVTDGYDPDIDTHLPEVLDALLVQEKNEMDYKGLR